MQTAYDFDDLFEDARVGVALTAKDLTPSDIGQLTKIQLTGHDINAILIEMEFQIKAGKKYYPTEIGHSFCSVQSNGQILWSEVIVQPINEYCETIIKNHLHNL